VENVERTENPKEQLHSAAVSYLGKVESNSIAEPTKTVAPIPGPAITNTTPPTSSQKPVAVGADGVEDSQDSDWLSRMSSQ